MTTQFFDRQEAARTNTVRLIVLFMIAVVGLVGTMAVVGYFAGVYVGRQSDRDAARRTVGAERLPASSVDSTAALFSVGAAAATAVVILLGSLFQIMSLRFGGGKRVAESLGGRPLSADTPDLAERRLMNIVEEMAIASGTPVPPVYLLPEESINAFAAGYQPGDAVIGVTRGAVDQLNRDELQGVIAHEFSHILNGDMRMSIRMIGILHGILLLSLIGHMLLRSIHFAGAGRSARSDRGSGGIVIAMIVCGLVLIILGSIGSFIGGLIKASVSRQREYLADASAVQFTRNPSGLAGALKRIGGLTRHGMLRHPNAGIASHMYFAQGIFEGFTGLLATHPPLEKRIRTIEPQWDGTYPNVSAAPVGESPAARHQSSGGRMAGAAVGFAGSAASAMPVRPSPPTGSRADDSPEVPIPIMLAGVSRVGEPDSEHRRYVAELLRKLDQDLLAAAHDPYSARALVLALLIDENESIRAAQFATLEQTISADVVALTRKLVPKVAAAPDAARLPLVDVALPMLRMMTAPQYVTFIKAFRELIRADNRLSVFEWALSQVLMRHLRREFEPGESIATRYRNLDRLVPEVSLLLTILARVGHEGGEVEAAFTLGAAELPGIRPELLKSSECSFAALDQAMAKLARASHQRRREILQASAATVCADGIVKVKEAELIRGIADLLDCPMPPLFGTFDRDP